jgi:pyruvate dehydrogenase E2 component (dihydrolipoamide acetyltransferase)
MAELVRLPKMSDTMTEGVIVKWNYKVGDAVKSGDILAEVETDKATMDMEVYAKGTILHFTVEEGGTIPVDGVIAVVGKEGEDYKALLESAASEAPAPAAEEKNTEPDAPSESTPKKQASESPAPAAAPVTSDGRVIASPLARKMASEKGLDLTAIAGSGDNGRIVKSDVENYTPAAAASGSSAIAGVESYDEINVSQMRKTIAGRLAESKFTAPHFYLTKEINVENAMAARVQMNEISEVKISMNDLVVKACAMALRKHPMVNSSWLGTKIRINHHIHIGVAMAVEDGLLVPVVRFADQKAISNISEEVKAYGKKAKEKKLQPADWAGNTFTISNLGMFGIDEFTAIINPPDACILAVGSAKDAIKIVDGQILPTKTMKVTLSCDHRVVDGVLGSQFLQTLANYLENPVTMLV